MQQLRLDRRAVLLYYSDPIEVLAAYLEAEPHDAVLLTFNPEAPPFSRTVSRELLLHLPPGANPFAVVTSPLAHHLAPIKVA